VRGAQEAAVQRLFEQAAEDGRAAWQRSALLAGVEVALVGAEMPGTPPRRAESASPGAPCPTCPGGRAGPGGAYAFPRPDATAATGGGRGGPLLRLNREPAALAALAARGDELGPRVARLLGRVTWPGKPGEVALTPLTLPERQRFEAGGEIYRNLCQACHQPDGRGLEPVAPSLIGSTLALARADITTRILLNGKEGAFGLMPPMGATLTDEQVASVLTYVRREWGQAGTPVDRATVSAVRALTADRSRPWTDAELVKLADPGRGERRE
jgi:mono/diheme cytochrome c family protein